MDEKLQVIIVGAGLGGLGAAISILMAGYSVIVLESAHEVSEIGAGIQILPNASRLLKYWGVSDALSKYATSPTRCNLISWKGKKLTSLNFIDSARKYGSPFWDFHRADLHNCLYERAVELGAEVRINSRVDEIEFPRENGSTKTTTVVLSNGQRLTADLVVGADGIASRTRECFLGRKDEPTPTGDLAYRVLLDTAELKKEAQFKWLFETTEVNYWMGPDCHVVTYHLRGGEKVNVVLLVPDDIPDGEAKTVAGNVQEMRDLFKYWDPRISALLARCNSVQKWKLCIRHELPQWSHPSGTYTMLGDAVHATLPYLASGYSFMLSSFFLVSTAIEQKDNTSGNIFANEPPTPSKSELKKALDVYESCRRGRTSRIVQRGNVQQVLYHLHDGPEQRERDRLMQLNPTLPGDPLVWRDPELSPWLLGYDHLKDVDAHWNQISVDIGQIAAKI